MAAAFARVAGFASASRKKGSDVYLITLDPGHFHAALVQKFMLPRVSPDVRVFAPAGDDVAPAPEAHRRHSTRAPKIRRTGTR